MVSRQLQSIKQIGKNLMNVRKFNNVMHVNKHRSVGRLHRTKRDSWIGLAGY